MIKRVTKETVKEAIVAAIKLPENRFEDGSLNWSFIRGDAYIEVFEPEGLPSPQVCERDKEKFYEYFDEFVSDNYPDSLSGFSEIIRINRESGQESGQSVRIVGENPPDLRPKATDKYGRFW